MPKTIEQWLLFEYVGLEFTPLSKPFKTREQAEKAREKYPERLRQTMGLGPRSEAEVEYSRCSYLPTVLAADPNSFDLNTCHPFLVI